jgi:redox-sensitive bicupin YhaK (pirin superfamily)
MAYVLGGQGYAGAGERAISGHELVVFGSGDLMTLRAADRQDGPQDALDVLLLGGLPIRQPIAHYGPFVMNTKDEILQAIDDFQSGRMGIIPAVDLAT